MVRARGTYQVRAERVIRLLLLTLVACAVAGMHSMGHPAAGHARAVTAGHEVAKAAVPAPVEVLARRTPHLPGEQGSPVWQVCVAILTAVGTVILLVVAAIRAAGRRAGVAPVRPVRATTSGRDPPAFGGHGLTLADLSVLRT